MEINSFSVEEYNFEAKPVELASNVRLHLWWRGIRDRKNMMRKFCLETGVDYPPIKTKRYALPNKYLIESKVIDYVAKVRDNIIISQHDDFANLQKRLNAKIIEVDDRISDNILIINSEEQYLKSLKDDLNRADDPSDIISLESRIKTQEAKIKNIENENTDWQIKAGALRDALKKNIASWKKQVDLSCGAIDVNMSKYCNSATRRIQTKLNFANFEYNEPGFSQNVQEILCEGGK